MYVYYEITNALYRRNHSFTCLEQVPIIPITIPVLIFFLANTVSNRRRSNTVKFVKVSRVLAFVSVFAFGLLPFAFASLRVSVSVSVCVNVFLE